MPDYWGRHLGIHRGRHNFDAIRYEVYHDATVEREALRKGLVDYRVEAEPRYWATGYDIPAKDKGWLVMRRHNYMSYVGFRSGIAFNTRQDKLSDRRVRQALSMAFDYEWGNRALNHGLYDRPMSYFPGSYLAARGAPSAAERRLLAPFRESLPAALFTEAFELPRSSGFGANRRALIDALDLFAEAGWRMRDGELRDEVGRPFSLRFVIRTANERRTLLPYVSHLARLGIRSTIRMVETAQFVNILNEGEFDVVFGNFGAGITPESGLRGRVHSSSASSALTNWAGINHPAVDKMLEKTLGARSMDELIAAARAWTASCCGTTTTSRWSASPGRAWSIGTSSAGRKRIRRSARASRTLGGGTRARRSASGTAWRPRAAENGRSPHPTVRHVGRSRLT